MLRLGRAFGRSLGLFVGHVMADDATADRAEDAVMAGIMAGDAADKRAFEAAFGFGGRRTTGGEERECERGGDDRVRTSCRTFLCSTDELPAARVAS